MVRTPEAPAENGTRDPCIQGCDAINNTPRRSPIEDIFQSFVLLLVEFCARPGMFLKNEGVGTLGEGHVGPNLDQNFTYFEDGSVEDICRVWGGGGMWKYK